MVDNVRVQRSEAGAVIEVDTAAGTLVKTCETLTARPEQPLLRWTSYRTNTSGCFREKAKMVVARFVITLTSML